MSGLLGGLFVDKKGIGKAYEGQHMLRNLKNGAKLGLSSGAQREVAGLIMAAIESGDECGCK